MIWKSQYHSRIAQIVDFITALLTFVTSYSVYHYLKKMFPKIIIGNFILDEFYILVILFLCYTTVLLFKNYNAYSYQRFTSIITEYSIIIKVAILNFLFSVVALFMIKGGMVPRTFLVLSLFIGIVFFVIQKTLTIYVASFIRVKGKDRKKVILIGTGTRALQFINTVNKNFGWGLDIIGILTGDNEKVGKEVGGVKIIDLYENIESVLVKYNPEEVIITISTRRFDKIRDIFESCEKMGVYFRLNSDFFGKITKNVKAENVFGLNIISFYPTRQSEWELIIKRMIDIIVSLVLIVLLLPVFIIIMSIIFFQDGFPVLYKWEIVGYKRKPIVSWKFRTMVKNADELKKTLLKNNEMTGPMFKLTNDPRILPVGHILRKYSLDELPQLFSVLKGDLSLVGPRPPLQYEFKEFDLWHRRKLSVKPGLTCLWQISGRNRISNFDDWARLDLEYIDNWSIWLDLKILLKTLPAVLSGKGAK